MSRVFLILRGDTAKAVEQALQKRIDYIDANARFHHDERAEMLLERAHLQTAIDRLEEPA